MKKYRLVFIVILVVIIFLVIYFLVRNDKLKFRDDYMFYNFVSYTNGEKIKVYIPSSNNVKYVNCSDVVNFMKSKTGIFYFGYPSCPWCRNVVEVVVEVAKENDLDIYYVDSSKIENNDLKEILNFLDSYLRKDNNEEKRLYVPDVYFVKDGNIINHHIGSIVGQTNPYHKLKDKGRAELKNIYLDFIKEMNN